MNYGRLTFLVLPLVASLALLTGACGVPLAVSGASYAADGALLVGSDKTAADHLASMVSKQDCALWRIIRNRAVCRPRDGDDDPYKVDYAEPQRMVAEDGVHYAPPLRAPADAPATSWDAAAYRPEAPDAPAASSTAAAVVADATAGPSTEATAGPAATVAPPASCRRPVGHFEAPQGQEALGQEAFTRSGGASFLSRKASRLSSALKPMALRVSTVAEPMWGSRNALGRP